MSEHVQSPPGTTEAAAELIFGIAKVLQAEAELMPRGSHRHHVTRLTACALDTLEALEGTDAS